MTKINIEREEFIRVGTTLYKLVNQPRLNGGYVRKRGMPRRSVRTTARDSWQVFRSMTVSVPFPTM